MRETNMYIIISSLPFVQMADKIEIIHKKACVYITISEGDASPSLQHYNIVVSL